MNNRLSASRKQNLLKNALTLLTALAGGGIFSLLHIPIPWLLGPMIAVMVSSLIRPSSYRWPGQFRNAGMIAVGYTMGLSLTLAAIKGMAAQLPSMIFMTILLLALCAGIAYLVSKLSDTDFNTALMGSIPGGLSQVLILAEETEGIQMTIVTVTQVIRLMLIVICVPLLVLSPMFGYAAPDTVARAAAMTAPAGYDWSALFPNILVYAAAAVLAAWGGSRIRLPTAYLLGPALTAAVIQMLGLHGPQLPPIILAAAQLFIGSYVGLLLKPHQLPNKLRTLALALGSGLLLVVGALGLSLLLTKLQGVSYPTALLSLAPGGMDQMGIIAHLIHADLSMVAGYQLFRMFFIFFAVPPLLRWLFAWQRARRARQTGQRL